MKRLKWAFSAIGCAVLLAGCGGSDSPRFSQLVSFGDSLSDVGSYRVGTVAAVGGGKWTVNSASAKNWTEWVAARYELPAPCPAQTGLFPLIPGFTGAPIQNFAGCRNYAQGSARVTSPAGPNSTAVQAAVSAANGGGTAGTTAAAAVAPAGLMATPLATQLSTHLATVGGGFGDRELVTVMAGANDFFMHINAAASAAAGGATAVGAAQLAGWSAADQTAVAPGGAGAASAGANAAVRGMAQAATELVTLVKTQIVAKGARYVVVINLPDASQTPDALSQDANTRGLMTAMINAFNNTLQSGLTGTGGVLLLDAYTQGRDQVANPAAYKLSNVTTAACSKTSSANPLAGSSLSCTPASTIAGDTSQHYWADGGGHLTPAGYQLLADFVISRIQGAGWP